MRIYLLKKFKAGIMLVAKNIQDEDLDYASGNVISSYLINKYTKNQLL